uniref:restriction endonuclease subunit S n=1 Tax=Phocaeicola plebeius TaxID=310297 RepID=UPI0026E9FEDE
MENRYDKYKDSGIAWIGEIPEHWELRKGKNLFKLRNSKGNNNAILLAATQKYGMIPQSQVEGVVQVKQNTDLNTFKTVHKNDYVISLRSFQGGFEMSKYEGVCSPAYQVFYSTKPCCNYFFKYMFKSYGFVSQINAFTLGIREGKNIQYEDFSLMKLPLPTIQEQQSIATYLDQKCSEIDELITLQEEMITKLQSYKQSVITEAVTKGLDKNVPLKDSGIEWIGEIPEHWNICKLKNIFLLSTGTTPKDFDQTSEEDNLINWYTPSDILDSCNDLFSSQRKLSEKVIYANKISLFPIGTLLYVGIGASAGKVGYANENGYSNQQITGLIPLNCYSRFYFYYLSA